MGSGAQIALYSMTTSPNSNIFSHIKMSVWVCITYLLDTYGTVCSGKTCITEPFNPSSVTLRWPFPFLLSSVCIALSVCLRVCICVCPYISLISHFHHPSRFWLKCLQYRVATPQTAPVTQSNRFYRSHQKVLKLRISFKDGNRFNNLFHTQGSDLSDYTFIGVLHDSFFVYPCWSFSSLHVRLKLQTYQILSWQFSSGCIFFPQIGTSSE